jgi:hypothetical protein
VGRAAKAGGVSVTQVLVPEIKSWRSFREIVCDTIIIKRKHAHGTAFTVYACDVCRLHSLPLHPVYLAQIDTAIDEIYEETLMKPEMAEKLGCKGLEKGRNAHRKYWRFEVK